MIDKKKQYRRFLALQRKATHFNFTAVHYLPRYAVVLIDVCLIVLALIISLIALNAIKVDYHEVLPLSARIFLVLGVNIVFFFLFRTYAGLIRHSSFIDLLKLIFASVGTLLVLSTVQYSYFLITGQRIFIMVGLVLYTVLSFTFLMVFRIFIKQFYESYKELKGSKNRKKVVILGVDDHSISLGKALAMEAGDDFHLVGFVTEKPLKSIRIAGKPVISIKQSLEKTLATQEIDGVLLIGKTLSVKERNEVVNVCMGLGLQVYSAPLVEEWKPGTDAVRNIKSIDIEDLLDRDAIQLDEEDIRDDLRDNVVLITGAAGSIGSELVRQIARYKPRKLILVDQAETPLHSLELELQEKFPDLKFRSILASISNKYRMEALFKKYDFSIIYHAAAYKHVPMIEKNPREAILVNLLGTVNLANLSSRYGVNKFVMVSTDKAVNPTNVMGASKRAAEMFVQSFQQEKSNKTQFITTRFGNVLGSNGSVIPYFRDQIAKGGPVTVTHPDIIRYFMTIPEACQLVLQAGTMGRGGEIFVFDMGKPVKIMDLAKRMIKLSGFRPYTDIDIEISGLRPGEKLYEELLSEESQTLPTHNAKILIAKVDPQAFSVVHEKSKVLIKSAVRATDKKETVRLLKQMVPEFKSKNSLFEELDIKIEEEPQSLSF